MQDLRLDKQYKESDLIKALKQKDITAFKTLYDKYSPALYTFILQIVRDEDLGSKELQKVFNIVWNTIEDYNPEKGTLFIWMLQIARNAALERKNKSAVEGLHVDTLQAKNNFAFQLDGQLNHLGLKKLINQLQDGKKQIVDDYLYEGLSIEQIAKASSISDELVRKRMKEALFGIKVLL